LGVFVLAFLLIVMVASVGQVQRVDAADSPPLTINADGSITPSTALITSVDNITYTLTDNITADSGYQVVNVLRDNVVLDGAGYAVTHVNRYSGIYVGYRNNVTVKNLKIINCGDGIVLDADNWLTIDNCTLEGNYRAIMNGYTPGPKNFTFTNNKIIAPLPTRTREGVNFASVNDALISGNTIQHCQYGLVVYGYENVTIKDNLIDDCSWGIWPLSSDSGIWIFDNTFSNNGCGINVGGGAHPTLEIHHNRFFSNNEHARGEGATLEWDDGYPSGGNYWSGYTDVDNNSGPYQNITGSDGIWDHAYHIDPYGNIDHYPFVSPYETQPPTMTILSPENKTYAMSTGIPLTFTVDESTGWIGYSLDGQANVTITGNATLPALSEGPHYVFVYANDTVGNMGKITAYFTVDTVPPTAHAGSDQAVNEDVPITLDGSASTDNVDVTSYTWTFIDGTVKTLTGEKPVYTFKDPGVYTITLNVTDAAGNWATDTIVITVALDETEPVADAGEDQTVDAGATVSFDAGGSTDNVGIISYDWDFGDGSSGTGKTTSHDYTNAGTYTVTLTVRDAAGNQAANTMLVTVNSTGGFPWWILLVALLIAVVVIIVVLVFWKRRKETTEPTR
jgi:parallel beta-helix repeat protein